MRRIKTDELDGKNLNRTLKSRKIKKQE